MKLKELEVYSEASNYAVIRASGRSFPGSLIQGDSLSTLCAEAKKISEFVKGLHLNNDDILYLVQDHQEKLLERLLHYQNILTEHGVDLPYSGQVTNHDLVKLVSDEE